jgi:hypothetical protein
MKNHVFGYKATEIAFLGAFDQNYEEVCIFIIGFDQFLHEK